MADGGGESGGPNRIGQGLQAGGSLVRGIAGFQSGKANARAARAEANAALRTGVARDDEIRLQARRTAGEAIAAMGAGGGQLGSGSALDVIRDIELESGLDQLRVRTEAQNTYNARNFQARLYRRQGAWNLLGGVMSAGDAFVGGGGG